MLKYNNKGRFIFRNVSTIEMYQTQIKLLEDSVFHLKRSNEEMMEYDPEGLDSDLTEACVENLQIISRKEIQIAKVRLELAQLELLMFNSDVKNGELNENSNDVTINEVGVPKETLIL